MLRAVIFDFDGVITDSEMLHLKAFNKALAPYNIQITKEQYYKELLGLSDLDLFNSLIKKGFKEINDEEIRRLLEEKKKAFEKLARTECKPISGVREFLEMLKTNNITMAICSGALSNEIQIILEANRLEEFFVTVVSAEQVKRGKPHPDGFQLTLKKLNERLQSQIHPAECIVIEDSHWGLEAAKEACMKTIAVTNSYDADKLSAADKITDNLATLSISSLQQLCT